MRKLCATITAIGATVLSSLVQAEGITGIYSCSSGVNNDRPVTYMFNSDLMLRNNAKEAPFEFLSTLNNGMLLYVGKQKTKNFNKGVEKYGYTKESLSKWAYGRITWFERGEQAISDQLGLTNPGYVPRGPSPDFDLTNYILLKALGCSLNVESPYKGPLVNLPDSAIPYLNNCQKSADAAAKAGIDDIEEYFIAKNFERFWDNVAKRGINPHRYFFETKIVTVDLNSAQIYEANIDQPETTKEYNCTVLDIDVPKIDPPESAVKAST